MGRRRVSLTKTSTRRSDQGDETTRRLCAGVHLDREFRDLVVRGVLHDHRRRVAPSYGFDLVAVVHQAWRSWCLDAVQHTCVLAVLLITAYSSPPACVAVLCAAFLPRMIVMAAGLAPEVLSLNLKALANRHLHKRLTIGRLQDAGGVRERGRQLKVLLLGCLLMITAPVLSAGAAGTPFSAVAAQASAALAFLIISTALATAARHHLIAMTRIPGRQRPAHLNGRLRAIEAQQGHTVVVYRRPEPKRAEESAGLVSPRPADDEPRCFVGIGELVHRWQPPLAIQLLRPKEGLHDQANEPEDISQREYVKPPFQAHELVEHLRRKMRPIGHTADPTRLPGYQVWDRVFVAESDIGAARVPLNHAFDTATLRQIIDEPYGALQHFLEIRTTSSGELVTTVFLRVTVKGRSLSLDFATGALTRTPDSYQRLGRLARKDKKALLCTALLGCLRLPSELQRAWRVVEIPHTLVRTWLAGRRAASAPGAGSRLSVREDRAADWRESVLDHPTILDQMKIIELRLLKTTEDFLSRHNVDTSAFTKRAETIISANVLNMGRMDITESAIGDSAQVNRHTPVVVQGAQP